MRHRNELGRLRGEVRVARVMRAGASMRGRGEAVPAPSRAWARSTRRRRASPCRPWAQTQTCREDNAEIASENRHPLLSLHPVKSLGRSTGCPPVEFRRERCLLSDTLAPARTNAALVRPRVVDICCGAERWRTCAAARAYHKDRPRDSCPLCVGGGGRARPQAVCN